MASVTIILNLPIAGQLPHLTQVPERIHIKNIFTVAAIKTLDIAILLGPGGWMRRWEVKGSDPVIFPD